MAEAAAGYNENMQMLNGLSQQYRTTATVITGKIREIGEGMISMATAAEVAMQGLAKQMTPDQMYQLAKAAVVLKDVMGTTANEAFRTLASAMETGKEKTIKLAVGVIDLKDRYGEAADKMTDAEKSAALLAMVMERVHDIQGRTTEKTKSVADEMETLKVNMQNLQLEMGQKFIQAGVGVYASFQAMAAGAIQMYGAIAKLNEYWYAYKAAVTFGEESKKWASYAAAWAEEAKTAGAAAVDLAGKSQASFALMTAGTDAFQKATVKADDSTDAFGLSIGKQEAAAKAAAEAQKEQAKVIEETSKAMDALLKVMQAYGAEQIKIAGSAFATSLKAENVTVVEMTAALTTYTAALKTVYDARIAGEKAVAQAMKESGALTTPKSQLEAQAAILKTEKEYLVTRLAGWQTYYDALSAQHAKSILMMATREKELATLEKSIADQRRGATEAQASLQEKLMIAQGKAATDYTIYYMKQKAAEDIYNAAMKSSGDERIKGLEAYKKAQAELTNVVTNDGKEWITQQTTIQTAMGLTDKAQEEIVKEQNRMVEAKQAEIDKNKTWASELATEMESAKGKMTAYTKQITDLSEIMLKMDKEIAMTVSDKASGPLMAIKSLLDSIQSKTVTVTVNQQSGSGGGSRGGDTGNYNPTGNAQQNEYNFYNGGGISSLGGGMTTLGGGMSDLGWGMDTLGGDMGGMGEDLGGGMEDLGGGMSDLGAGLDDLGAGWADFGGGWAKGGVFNRGNVTPFAGGGVVDRPTFFPMARGMGVMGEAGPEAVMPLTRGRDGKLGVKASGGSVINLGGITIIGTNKSPEQLAREIVKPLKAELRRLAGVS